jgi:hypothetical protein
VAPHDFGCLIQSRICDRVASAKPEHPVSSRAPRRQPFPSGGWPGLTIAPTLEGAPSKLRLDETRDETRGRNPGTDGTFTIVTAAGRKLVEKWDSTGSRVPQPNVASFATLGWDSTKPSVLRFSQTSSAAPSTRTRTLPSRAPQACRKNKKTSTSTRH